ARLQRRRKGAPAHVLAQRASLQLPLAPFPRFGDPDAPGEPLRAVRATRARLARDSIWRWSVRYEPGPRAERVPRALPRQRRTPPVARPARSMRARGLR